MISLYHNIIASLPYYLQLLKDKTVVEIAIPEWEHCCDWENMSETHKILLIFWRTKMGKGTIRQDPRKANSGFKPFQAFNSLDIMLQTALENHNEYSVSALIIM